MKIIILGSCVSRDPFDGEFDNVDKESIAVKRLFARCSLISLNSPSLNIELSEIQGLDPFECRCVFDDLNKVFYKYINTRDLSDTFLLLDFIDERVNVLQSGTHFLTISTEYLKSNLSGRFTGVELSRLSNEVTDLWKISCSEFYNRINSFFPPNRIILHKAFWFEQYLDTDIIRNFENIEEISEHNKILTEYYDCFEKTFPGIHIIDLNNMGFLADKSHKWDLAPFHYERKYYEKFLTCLDNIRILS